MKRTAAATTLALMLFAPQYLQQFLPAQVVQPQPQQQPPREDQPRFVFVQPRVELPPTRKPDRVEMSDLDRSARSPEKSEPQLENPLPMARGNSTERTEAAPEEKMRGQGPAPQPAPPAPPVETPSAIDQRQADAALMQRPQLQQPPPGGQEDVGDGVLGVGGGARAPPAVRHDVGAVRGEECVEAPAQFGLSGRHTRIMSGTSASV